jgi:pyridoxal phosphate enzyme (YggS family)
MTGTASSIDALRAAHARVLDRIAAACARVGRDPGEIELVAVSKTVDAARLRDAVAAGIVTLGENRVQEGEAKRPDVPGARWELVGPLQSNKARKAIETFERIQTVDSVALAERLDRIAGETGGQRRYPVLVQVNVDEDPAKSGFDPDAVASALDALLALPNLEIQGLMTVGRVAHAEPEARATFRSLRELSAAARSRSPRLGSALSMGMSDDFELAVEEGATIVRVGRAIFGERPHRHGAGPLDHTHP